MSGKRQNVFGQGRPERPYEERDSGPEDVPQRATAAQLATRKIKSVKARRPAGSASPNLSQSANFGAPQASSFNFGASTPAPGNSTNNNNAFNFGASTAFGGGATSSFPPAQPAASTNSFASSSFPAFGGSSSQTTGFNPQPPSAGAFNFTAGASTGANNPFASTTAPTANGTGAAPSFGGGSIFSQSQPASNPFGGLAQNNTTSSAAESGGMFGTIGGASQPSMFGGISSSAPNATSTQAPVSQPFTFGATSSTAQTAASTPATSNIFGFSVPAQSTPAPAQNSLFSGFGTNAQKSESTPAAATPQKTMFGGFNTGTQPTAEATPAAPATSIFTFGTPAQKTETATTTAPPTTLFGSVSSTAQPSSTPAPAAAANPFANLQPAASPAPPLFQFGSTQQTPQAQDKAPTTSNSLFSSIKPAEQSSSATPEAPKANLFASLAKPSSDPVATPVASNSGFNLLSASQTQDKPSATLSDAFKAPEPPKATLFSGFSTPQPKKTADSDKPPAGLFTTQPKASTGMFSQPFQSESHNSSNLFKTQPSSSLFTPQKTAATETPQDATAQQSTPKEASNPFAKLPTAAGDQQNLFNPPKEQAPAPPASTMPAFTASSALAASTTPELPKIPKAHVPKDWAVPSVEPSQNGSVLYKTIVDLSSQLRALNLQYRDRMNSIDMGADLSALSLWHHQASAAIKKKIDNAKKQRATANGVTGFESALSTKRKVSDGSPESRDLSTSKKARGDVTPASPTPQPSVSTSRFNPPATTTSNLFARAIDNKGGAAEPSSPSTPKTAQKPAPEPAKAAPAFAGFSPSLPTTNETSATTAPGGFKPSVATAPALGGFKPSVTAAPASGGFKPSGFTPSFGNGSAGGGGSFLGQFAKTAKTYEELAAERKKKEFDEDYDSDEETKEEWNARWDAKEAKRLAEEKEKMAAAPGFTIPAAKPADKATPATKPPASNPFASLSKPASTPAEPTGSTPAEPTGSTTPVSKPPTSNPFAALGKSVNASTKPSETASPVSNPFASLAKSTSGTTTPGLFGSRTGSPAPSAASGVSVLNAPSAVKPTSTNIFGHLSSNASSVNGADDSDDSDEEQGTGKSQSDQAQGSVEPSTPTRKPGESETESEKAVEETQKQAETKGSLLSRMSKGGEGETGPEKGNSSSPSLFGQTNGTQTPPNKAPFAFFDFGAAGPKTAPPKSETFAGDQTFKPGTPIKFGEMPATEKKAAPTFSFAPITSTTPSKPPPPSLFNFGSSTAGSSLLGPNAAQSGPGSVLSSRAATPLSEADTSAASAAEDEEEGGKQEQIDLSELTEEEKTSNEIVFFTDSALVKQFVDRGEGKDWENIAKGRLWILKDKSSGKCFIRLRIASGATRLNYQILPALRTAVTGSTKKMVKATKPGEEGGLTQLCYILRSREIAEEFSTKYDDSIPLS